MKGAIGFAHIMTRSPLLLLSSFFVYFVYFVSFVVKKTFCARFILFPKGVL